MPLSRLARRRSWRELRSYINGLGMRRSHGLDSGLDPAGGDLANWDVFHPGADGTAESMTLTPLPVEPSPLPGSSFQTGGAVFDANPAPSADVTAFDPASGMASLVNPI